jgi:hypothetical protein
MQGCATGCDVCSHVKISAVFIILTVFLLITSMTLCYNNNDLFVVLVSIIDIIIIWLSNRSTLYCHQTDRVCVKLIFQALIWGRSHQLF